MRDTPSGSWIDLVQAHREVLGVLEHVAAGHCAPGAGDALATHGPDVVGACLWAVGHGLPDEVVARRDPGQVRAVLSWVDPEVDVEVLLATGIAARQWLVLTGDRGEVEVRPAPFDEAPGEVWVSDGAGTERLPFAGGGFEDVTAAARSVLAAVARSAAQDGAPVRPS